MGDVSILDSSLLSTGLEGDGADGGGWDGGGADGGGGDGGGGGCGRGMCSLISLHARSAARSILSPTPLIFSQIDESKPIFLNFCVVR